MVASVFGVFLTESVMFRLVLIWRDVTSACSMFNRRKGYHYRGGLLSLFSVVIVVCQVVMFLCASNEQKLSETKSIHRSIPRLPFSHVSRNESAINHLNSHSFQNFRFSFFNLNESWQQVTKKFHRRLSVISPTQFSHRDLFSYDTRKITTLRCIVISLDAVDCFSVTHAALQSSKFSLVHCSAVFDN